MLCARVSSLGLWVGVICGSATAGLEEAATSRPSTSTSYRDPQPRCATTAALEGRSRCSTCRIRARGPALVPLAGCLRGPRALACLRGRWGSERLAGQLPRLHLDRLPCVHTRIERSHKLLQRWRWPCGLLIGRCLGGGPFPCVTLDVVFLSVRWIVLLRAPFAGWWRLLVGGEGEKSWQRGRAVSREGGRKGDRKAIKWWRTDTERLLVRVYLCASVSGLRAVHSPPSLPPSPPPFLP